MQESLSSLQAIILAAGRSKRFNTQTSKLLERICGQEMILYPAKLLAHMRYQVTLIVGYQADTIKNVVTKSIPEPINFIEQTEQHGTGHAISLAQPWHADHILVVNGDCPLINQELINQLKEKHIRTKATITFVTAHYADPDHQYGRVIRKDGIIRIIEKSDYKNNMHDQCCINGGIYLFDKNFLQKHISDIKPNHHSQELYITDLISIAAFNNYKVETLNAPYDTIRGVNTLKELWTVEQIKRCELIYQFMQQGVIFSFPQSTHLEVSTRIEPGTRIGAGAHLIGSTSIGKNCIIGPFCILENVLLKDNIVIESHTVLQNCIIENNAHIGPFARIRNESNIQEYAQIGNFVEITKSSVGKKTKVKHLTYLGNAQIGSEVNIGAGTITCNYDGFEKHTTTINDEVFIGSNNTLIAPLIIEKKSYTAAGSTITQNVPQDALAIARARQITKENYVPHLKKRIKEKKEKKFDTDIIFSAAKKTINDPSV